MAGRAVAAAAACCAAGSHAVYAAHAVHAVPHQVLDMAHLQGKGGSRRHTFSRGLSKHAARVAAAAAAAQRQQQREQRSSRLTRWPLAFWLHGWPQYRPTPSQAATTSSRLSRSMGNPGRQRGRDGREAQGSDNSASRVNFKPAMVHPLWQGCSAGYKPAAVSSAALCGACLLPPCCLH